MLATAVLLGLAVTAGWLTGFDVPILQSIALTATAPRGLTAAALVLTRLGDPEVRSVFVVLVCIIFAVRRRRRAAALYLVTIIVSIGGHTLAKIAYARARPRLTPWLDQVADLSYPSGHAAGAMVILLAAALLVDARWLRWPAIALALAIGATRPMLGVHWPTDVIGGWLWGAGFALIGVGIAQRLGLRDTRSALGLSAAPSGSPHRGERPRR